MTATSVVCPECGSPVAPGRLSCQSCGTLLASVVGSDRRPSWTPASSSLAEIDEDLPLASALGDDGAAIAPAVVADVAEPAPAPKRGPRRLSRPKPATPAAPAKARYVKSPPDDVPPPDPTSLFGPVPSVAPPILHDWSEDAGGSNGVAVAAAPIAAAPAPAPALAPSPPAVRQQRPVGTAPVPAPTWPRRRPTSRRSRHDPHRCHRPPLQRRPGRASRAPLPAAAANGNGAYGATAPAGGALVASAATAPAADAATGRGLSDWLALGGSVLVIISFVLPWATDGVIGSRGTGFTADWGLANPGHLILIVATIAVLVLQVVDNPVPVWVRSAALPLIVGGILTGLAFAYYARPSGGGSGVAVLLAGALLLLVSAGPGQPSAAQRSGRADRLDHALAPATLRRTHRPCPPGRR